MKLIFNLSKIFLITYFVCFSINGSYISVHSIYRTFFDIDNNTSQNEDLTVNSFCLEDEDSNNDTFLDSDIDFRMQLNYLVRIFTFNKCIPDSFLSIIWQPPKF